MTFRTIPCNISTFKEDLLCHWYNPAGFSLGSSIHRKSFIVLYWKRLHAWRMMGDLSLKVLKLRIIFSSLDSPDNSDLWVKTLSYKYRHNYSTPFSIFYIIEHPPWRQVLVARYRLDTWIGKLYQSLALTLDEKQILPPFPTSWPPSSRRRTS